MAGVRFSIEEAKAKGLINPEQEAMLRGARKDAGPAARGKSNQDIEGEQQAEIIELFELRHPQLAELLMHPANGGSRRNKFEGWRLKKMGVRKGASDLLLPVARHGFHGFWLEHKRERPFNSAVTKEQREWIDKMREQGYAGLVSYGVDEAMEILESYLSKSPSEEFLLSCSGK
jgi:hypothetical protein